MKDFKEISCMILDLWRILDKYLDRNGVYYGYFCLFYFYFWEVD